MFSSHFPVHVARFDQLFLLVKSKVLCKRAQFYVCCTGIGVGQHVGYIPTPCCNFGIQVNDPPIFHLRCLHRLS